MSEHKTFSAQFAGLSDYLEQTFPAADKVLKTIRQRAQELGLPAIHVAPNDGRLLQFFARLINARHIVEIGTLAGYSTICLARGLAEGGKIWAFEKSPEHAAVAREHFKMFGFENRIEVIEGDALHNLLKFKSPPLDLVFIDADKTSYPKYLNWALHNVRTGGLILADNTLAWGHIHRSIADDEEGGENIKALQSYNREVASLPNLFSVMIPTGEGLTASVILDKKD